MIIRRKEKPIPPPPLTPERAAAVLAMAPNAEPEPDEIDVPFSSAFLPDFSQIQPRSEEENRAWHWKNEITPLLKASGLPERFWSEHREWKSERQRNAFNVVRSICTRVGAIVVLTGVRGTGKTTIAAEMIQERAWSPALPPWERQPPYRKLTDIIAKYKALYSDFGSVDTDSLMAARDAFCRHPLAVLDEIHDSEDQKLRSRILTDILDRRYAGRKDTILISNQTVQEFRDTVSDSVLSRIQEHGTIIRCEWPSFRQPTP